VIHNSHFASSLFVIKPIQAIEMWKLTSAQEDEVGEQREEQTKRQRKGERMGEYKKEDRNAGAWSLLPLRQHCLGTASLSGIINNSATPVSRLCFMHIHIHTHTHVNICTYISYTSISIFVSPSFYLFFLVYSHNVFRLRHEHLEHGGMAVSVDRLD